MRRSTRSKDYTGGRAESSSRSRAYGGDGDDDGDAVAKLSKIAEELQKLKGLSERYVCQSIRHLPSASVCVWISNTAASRYIYKTQRRLHSSVSLVRETPVSCLIAYNGVQ
jgi:hypothetical protein